jgi:hypothetical protein
VEVNLGPQMDLMKIKRTLEYIKRILQEFWYNIKINKKRYRYSWSQISNQMKQTLDDAISGHKQIQQVIRNLKEKQDVTD